MTDALLLINIQNDCFPGGTVELPDATEAAIKARKLLLAFRQIAFPVIHLQHIATTPQAAGFRQDTQGAAFHASTYPNLGEVIFRKNFSNAFQQTPLSDYLRKEKVSQLIIAGMMAHRCISATTRAAASLGFSCIVAHDACAACALQFNDIEVSAAQVHATSMAALEETSICIMSTDELITKIHSFELKGS